MELAQDKPTRRADALADRLRAGMKEVLARREVAGLVYGESSVFHVFLEPPDATTRVGLRISVIVITPIGASRSRRSEDHDRSDATLAGRRLGVERVLLSS
jgi:DNA gyrase inhibitor GyrI